MKWYKSLHKRYKVRIREVFQLATGMSLNDAMIIFSFSECMDLLEEKLRRDGFALPKEN